MCLAIPGMITDIDNDRIANVDILGAQRSASLDLVPQAQVGDYVLVHAGFAIEVVDPQFAQETLDLINEFPELCDLDNPAGSLFGTAVGNAPAAATESPQNLFAALAADDDDKNDADDKDEDDDNGAYDGKDDDEDDDDEDDDADDDDADVVEQEND